MTDTTVVTSDEKLCKECGAPFSENDDRRFATCSGCRPTTETKTTDLDDGMVALRLDIQKHEAPPMPPRSFYSLGVTEDAPWHYVTAGGVAFQRYMGSTVKAGDKVEFRDNTATGSPVHHLTDAHVARILEEVKLKVVRNYRIEMRELSNGDGLTIPHGSIISMKENKHRPFVPRDGDRPLGEFLWMVKVKSKKHQPLSEPPTLVPRG